LQKERSRHNPQPSAVPLVQ